MDLEQSFIEKAKKNPKKIVFPEGKDERIVIAAYRLKEMNIAFPIIIGNIDEIKKIAVEKQISLEGIKIIDPVSSELLEKYAKEYAEKREMKEAIAKKLVKKTLPFATMMVACGDADGMVAGVVNATASVISTASLAIGFQEGLSTPSSFFIMIIPEFLGETNKAIIFADCAVNIRPDAKQLAEIAIASGTNAKALLGIDPKIAFLSFSTKGSANHKDADKVIEAVEFAKKLQPDWEIDGELQGDAALIPSVGEKKAKGSTVAGNANVLVFPDLDAGNIAYKLVQRLGKAKALGPILQGFAAPVNDMSRGASVEELIGVTAITVVQAQNLKENK